MKSEYRREYLSLLTGVLGYFAAIIVVSLHRNSYDILDFCGSLRDFTSQEPVPAVCVSMPEYVLRAAVHPDFAFPASVVGLAAALLYYGEVWKHLKRIREGVEW